MAKQLQLRRGTTAQHSTFTGAAGEVTIDTDKKVVVVHDGSTAGGTPLAKDSAKVDKVSSTDNAIVRFDGTSGAVQNSSVVIDDSGNVGIGVTPSAKLEASDSGLTTGFFTNPTTSGATTGSGIGFKVYNGSAVAQNGSIISTASSWSYGTYSANQLSISTNGSGGVRLASASAPITFHTGDASNSGVSAERMRIDSAGNVGIGTSSPIQNLDIRNNSGNSTAILSTGNAGSSGVLILQGLSTGGAYGTGVRLYADPVDSSQKTTFRIETRDNGGAYSEKMRIDSSGNVGIGTSSPSYTIDVYGTGHKQIAVRASQDGYAADLVAESTTGRAGIRLKATAGNYWNIGEIGTGNFVICNNANGNMATNERMRIDSNGNVGIGTSSPSYKLHLSSDSAAKPSTNTWTISSDERLKENIELADLDRCYEIVKTIPLKRYTWKDSVYAQEQVSDRSKLGWIANDVQTVFPKAVNTHSQQLATFKIELKDVEEQKLISEAIVGQEEIKDEDGNIIQEFIEAKEAVYETITVQKEEKVYDVLDDCLDLNSDQIYAVMYGAIQKLQLTVEALTARIEALEAK